MQVVAVGVSNASSARNPLSPCLLPRCLVALFITTIVIIAFRARVADRIYAPGVWSVLYDPLPVFFGEDRSGLRAWSIKA